MDHFSLYNKLSKKHKQKKTIDPTVHLYRPERYLIKLKHNDSLHKPR